MVRRLAGSHDLEEAKASTKFSRVVRRVRKWTAVLFISIWSRGLAEPLICD